MTTAPTKMLTDTELVYEYLGKLLANGGRDQSVDWFLAEAAAYYRELQQARAMLREAEESSARGESKPLDLDSLFARADKRLKEKGIPEE